MKYFKKGGNNMKKELIGVLICTLLISVAVAPVVNALTNEVNIVKEQTTIASSGQQSDKQSKVAGDSPIVVSKNVFSSNSAKFQVSEYNRINNIKLDPPQPAGKHLEVYDIGLFSNLKAHGFDYKFNCVNVFRWFWVNDECYFSHYTNGEELYISGSYRGILTKHFVFAHWYLGC